MPPAVTIGIPVYNAAPWLQETLRSVFAQSLRDWELLLVDDGSTDASLRIAQGVRDPRVHVFADGRHLGLAARLNQIVGAAQAPVIARMDADDLMHPLRLERQLAFLAAHPEVDAAGCSLAVLDRAGKPCGRRCMPAEHAAICAQPLRGVALVHATVVARAAWLRRYPYDGRNLDCEDWGLWYSSFSSSSFANLAEPLYFYREHDSFSVGKYVRAKRHLISFLWREARPRWGTPATAWRCLGHELRIAAYLAAAGLGLEGRLLRRRSRPLEAGQARELEAALTQVRSTPLPGES